MKGFSIKIPSKFCHILLRWYRWYTCSAGAAKATVAITNNRKYFIVAHLKFNKNKYFDVMLLLSFYNDVNRQ